MITSFKELTVWQKADELAHNIFDLTDKFPRKYLLDLTSQLRRSSLSVPTNIAEGCASFHTGEFLQFLNISRRSLSESHYLLYFAYKRNLIDQSRHEELEYRVQEVNKLLNGLIKSLRKKKHNTQHSTLNTGFTNG